MPLKRSGRSVAAASRVIESEEVSEATIASGFNTAQRSWKILRLTSSFSTAVSITRSQSARSSSFSPATIRAIALALSSSLTAFLETWRVKLPLIVAMPDLRRSVEMSLSTTSKPANAATCAMPLPICPAPITPTFLITAAIMSSTGTARYQPRLPIPRAGRSDLIRTRPRNLDWIASKACPTPKKTPQKATPAGVYSSGRCFSAFSLAELAEFGRQLRNRLVEVGDQAVIGNLEDRRVLVLVDRDDHLGVLHAGQMLDRAGNADRNIELGGYDLAGLADLPIVRRITRIHRGTRSADTGAELVGERLDVLCEVLAALHGAATGDDDLGRGQLGTVALCDFLADKGRQARIGRRCDALDRRSAAFTRCGEGGGAHRDGLLGVLRLHRLDGVAGVDRTLIGVGGNHLGDFRDLHDVEQGCDARHHVLEARRRRRNDGVIGRRQRDDQRGQRLGQIVRIKRAVGEQHLLHTGKLCGRVRRDLGILAGHQNFDVRAERGRRGQGLVGRILERRIVVFGNQKRRHQSTPASFLSFDTSSATSLTLTPALRPAGSVVLRTSRRAVRSTP